MALDMSILSRVSESAHRGLFTVLSLVLLWYVLRNTFPVLILRDSLNREKVQCFQLAVSCCVT